MYCENCGQPIDSIYLGHIEGILSKLCKGCWEETIKNAKIH